MMTKRGDPEYYVDRPVSFQVTYKQDAYIRAKAWENKVSLAQYLRLLIDKEMGKKSRYDRP